MPAAPKKKTLPPSFSRNAAPFAPLALALLVGNAVLPGSQPKPPATTSTGTELVGSVCTEGLDWRSCHSEFPTGCSSTGKYDAYLNLLKNQLPQQTAPVQWFNNVGPLQQLERQFPQGLNKTNHADFRQDLDKLGERQIYGVVGYLYDVIVEGGESSNCELDDSKGEARSVDFHIYIGFDQGLAERIKSKKTTRDDATQINRESVIVEMTPHFRQDLEPTWTADAVKKQIGNRVKVAGQLMVDNEHYVRGQDCVVSDASENCWRGTVWELHPVTDFQVCPGGACADQNSAGWVPLSQSSGTENAGKATSEAGSSAAER